ncbi:MAG: hypothetical protein ABJZ55_02885 [Fuerstiella sp.]
MTYAGRRLKRISSLTYRKLIADFREFATKFRGDHRSSLLNEICESDGGKASVCDALDDHNVHAASATIKKGMWMFQASARPDGR